jgi:hypothetical protein
MVELCHHSPIRLNGIVFNELSTRIPLPFIRWPCIYWRLQTKVLYTVVDLTALATARGLRNDHARVQVPWLFNEALLTMNETGG